MNRAPLERRNTVPAGVQALDPRQVSQLFYAQKCVLIDVRTFTQYSESRVQDAVNVCIPSTLLKRNSFNFQRIREFVPAQCNKTLKLVDTSKFIVVYDQKTACLESCGQNSLLWTIAKLRQHLDEHNDTATLGFIAGGFSAVDRNLIDTSALPKDAQPVNPLPPVVTQNVNPIPHGISLTLNESLLRHLDRFPPWIQALFRAQAKGSNPIAKHWIQLQTAESSRLHRALCDHQLVAGDISKNRYSNIAPYQHTRVRLKRNPDYINASYIQAKFSNLRYIATQAPLPATFADFWQLVWDEQVPMIVMLTTLRSETGQIKGDNYWLPGHYRDIELVEVKETQSTGRIVLRSILLKRGSEERTITQLHYEDWPDVACPGSSDDFFSLLSLKRQLLLNPEDRVVVHCSAGCGRTGTFCTIDTVTQHLASHPGHERTDDIINTTVTEFRTQRLAMVQVQRQLLFCYDTVIMWYYQHFIAAQVPLTPYV